MNRTILLAGMSALIAGLTMFASSPPGAAQAQTTPPFFPPVVDSYDCECLPSYSIVDSDFWSAVVWSTACSAWNNLDGTGCTDLGGECSAYLEFSNFLDHGFFRSPWGEDPRSAEAACGEEDSTEYFTLYCSDCTVMFGT